MAQVIRASELDASGNQPIAFRGPRVKAAVVRGPANWGINYSTGRMQYRGAVMNQLNQVRLQPPPPT